MVTERVPPILDRLAAWAWRLIVIAIVGLAALWLVGRLKVVLFPVVIAVLLTRALLPVADGLRARRVPSGLAAVLTLQLIDEPRDFAVPVSHVSSFEQQGSRILDQLFHPDQEPDRLGAVDDAVIVGERGVHHRAQDDLTVDADRTFLDRVQAEDSALRRVDDRRR